MLILEKKFTLVPARSGDVNQQPFGEISLRSRQIIEDEFSVRFQKKLSDADMEKVYSYSASEGSTYPSSNINISKESRDCVVVLRTAQNEVFCCFTDQSLMCDESMNTNKTFVVCCNNNMIFRSTPDSTTQCKLIKSMDSIFPLAYFTAPEIMYTNISGDSKLILTLSKKNSRGFRFTIVPTELNWNQPSYFGDDWCKISQMQVYFIRNCTLMSLRGTKRKLSFTENLIQPLLETIQKGAIFENNVKQTFQSFGLLMNELYTLSESINLLIENF
jgi:hypothetical protein